MTTPSTQSLPARTKGTQLGYADAGVFDKVLDCFDTPKFEVNITLLAVALLFTPVAYPAKLTLCRVVRSSAEYAWEWR